MDLAMLDHAENLCHLEVMISTGLIRGNRKIGQGLDVWVSHRLYRSGNEIRVVSIKNDGSQSCIVLSKGMNKHVDKFHEENDEYRQLPKMMEDQYGELREQERNNQLHHYVMLKPARAS